MRTSILILNYRTPQLTIDCLRSLAPEVAAVPGARAIVVDNASPDDSARLIRDAIAANTWTSWAELLVTGRNGGFAFGNNVAIRKALASARPPDFIFVLNPDTIVHPGAIRAILEFMRDRPKIGIAGCSLEDGQGVPQCAAHRLPSPLGELEQAARLGILTRLLRRYADPMPRASQPHPCDWVSGSSMMVRREVFQDIGLMDEGYFLYFDEVDFCARALKAGWQIWHVPAARIVHLHGVATGIRQTRQRRGAYWYDSRRRFFLKHYGLLGLIAADVLWGIGRLSLLLRRSLGLGSGGNQDDPEWFSLDLLGGDLKAILSSQIKPLPAATGFPE